MPNHDKKLNIAVIGCGNWGKNHIRTLNEFEALHSISDHDNSRAAAYSSQYNVPFYSVEEIILHADIQGVVIATPAEHHFDLAMHCLEAGKAVFVENDLAPKKRTPSLSDH